MKTTGSCDMSLWPTSCCKNSIFGIVNTFCTLKNVSLWEVKKESKPRYSSCICKLLEEAHVLCIFSSRVALCSQVISGDLRMRQLHEWFAHTGTQESPPWCSPEYRSSLNIRLAALNRAGKELQGFAPWLFSGLIYILHPKSGFCFWKGGQW